MRSATRLSCVAPSMVIWRLLTDSAGNSVCNSVSVRANIGLVAPPCGSHEGSRGTATPCKMLRCTLCPGATPRAAHRKTRTVFAGWRRPLARTLDVRLFNPARRPVRSAGFTHKKPVWHPVELNGDLISEASSCRPEKIPLWNVDRTRRIQFLNKAPGFPLSSRVCIDK